MGRAVIYDPYGNPYFKAALAVGVLWAGIVAVRSTKFMTPEPIQRKARQNFTTNKVDRDIDRKNRALGRPVPNNPDVPFQSRHNYNRRRRSKVFW